MVTKAKIGYGAELHLFDSTAAAGAGALVELEEMIGIKPPSSTVDHVDATHFKSAGAYREFIAGLIETGEADMVMNYAAGSTTDLLCRRLKNAREVVEYMIVLPTEDGTWEITGSLLPKTYDVDIPIDDRMAATLGVKFSGPEVQAAGA
jgi:hypothetical protein